ncbi:tetratricopeptide repeat protein [Aquimarina sp. AD1]|uniref:tetratricopeptide repeat protein n=1 Tax=Aquimarina TaxID=290174 RepID=UPI000410AB5F|nr:MULTISPECIES: tetratricopeptide repeat protein [Aquimarina]AXT54244.1 tetratricopeptide repeat protein [Aquimarina sp. AD1]RKN28488.1 tetratricopeptide repeat protein [Aquimarina sp. AD1]
MKISNSIIVLLIGILIVSCKKEEATITNPEDYAVYFAEQNNQTTKETKEKLQFWNSRIKADSLQITALAPAATAYTELFHSTGDIAYLKLAEKALTKSVDVAAIGKSGYLLALAHNYISQHRFIEAKEAAQGAYLLKTNSKATEMVLFDISMELGEYENAEKYLQKITNQSDYNFLIRLAKWNDYKGNLDATIRNMEKALKIAESSKNKGLQLWSYTNLADYYGHAGRIEESYDHYLKALAIDPSNAYAKKGIAWIIYSYEHKPEEALKILDAVMSDYQSPDYFLLKAEIAEFHKNDTVKKINLIKYYNSVKDNKYGAMYNTHTALFLAEEYGEYDKALAIAEEEIQNRPTPQSYDLKAYILNLKGDHKEALSIAENYIVNKTFEPVANLHIAQIYKANNLSEKVSPIIEELMESSYELGPVISKELMNL